MICRSHTVAFRVLIDQVTDGSLLPAAFQRPYVWSAADVVSYLDSVRRGLPVGSFLLWSPRGEADLSRVARGRLGPVRGTGDARHVSMLLDGQNRLGTIAWLRHDFSQPLPTDLSPAEQETWGGEQRLVVDLLAQDFRFVPAREVDQGLRLPARAVVDTDLATNLVRECWLTQWRDFTEEQRIIGTNWFDRTQSRMRHASVELSDLAHATPEEAKEAFLRICRAGVPMTAAEFDHALRWEH